MKKETKQEKSLYAQNYAKYHGKQTLIADIVTSAKKEIEEKSLIDIDKIVKLRNLIITAIGITKKDKDKFKAGTPSHSYRLGMCHCLDDFKEKLNSLIIQG